MRPASDDRPTPLPTLSFEWPHGPSIPDALTREWLVTDGRGGYASGTLAGCNTRRYHGLFIPSLAATGRTVLLARVVEEARVGGERFRLDAEEHADGSLDVPGLEHLRRFALDGLLPEWEFDVGGVRLHKRLVLVHGASTLFVAWEHAGGDRELTLRLRPYPVLRLHDRPLPHEPWDPVVSSRRDQLELRARPDAPPMLLKAFSPCPAPFVLLPQVSRELLYRIEKGRGYEHTEVQVSPGYFECTLAPGQAFCLGVTSEDWTALDRDPAEAFALERERQRRLLERAPERAQKDRVASRLVLAADQFVIQPTRPRDESWARAIGQDARSVIAGYHWFTDWGRDTMISLEGLTLATGRHREAEAILRTFQHYVRDGLLPNLFPEGEQAGLYHTADATLWFFHAVDRYLDVTGDEQLLRDVFPTLAGIVEHHLKGTRYNIRIDPEDGLLTQGAEGYQLTWMDAKVDGWVVTPRRGKAVELNGLWFNAVRLMAEWAQRLGRDPRPYELAAERCHGAFNRRFWNAETGCLYDVVDGETGDDPAVRPNQIFTLSLRHPVLRRDRWESVLRVVHEQLVTPVGLRSLAPGHPDYKRAYDGNLRARDAAYHQGTVWAWLIGHYVDASLKVNPDKGDARAILHGLDEHLSHAGVGQISEIFDANEPFRPRGCIAQAWSVAEALRVFLKTA